MIDNFYEAFSIYVVLREFNQRVDSLEITFSTFKPLVIPKVKYKIGLRYRPSILDNIKYLQFFEDDQQIKKFIEVIDEFVNTHIYSMMKKRLNK